MLQLPMRRHALRNTLLLGLLAGFAACSGTTPAVRLEGRTTAGGQQYSVFYPQGLAIRVLTTRPDVADRTIQLSLAGAYTDLDSDLPLDLLVANGETLQPTAKVGFLDGVLTIIGDSVAITRIPKGQSPPGTMLARVRQQHGTLLLQELLVFGGRSVRAAGGSAFQRRALTELAGHQFAVVESLADITMQQFAADLRELGAMQALNLDTGGWDEGWYRAGSQVVTLGHRRTETARQSNWLVFARPQTEH